MFKWPYEYVREVEVPLKKVWEFYATPKNWCKWIDEIEFFSPEGEFQVGSVIQAKAKGKSFFVPFHVLELIQFQEYKLIVKSCFFFSNKPFLCSRVYFGEN